MWNALKGASPFVRRCKVLGSNLKIGRVKTKDTESQIKEEVAADTPPPNPFKSPSSSRHTFFHPLKGIKGAFKLSGIVNFQKKLEKYFSTGDDGPKYFYKLALQRIGVSRFFTIHGLWIHKFSDKMFKSDDASILDEQQLLKYLGTAGLLKMLSENWPSVEVEGGNSKLWLTQWMKHGRHFGIAMEMYFRLTLELYDKIPTKDLNLTTGAKQASEIVEELSLTLKDIYGNKAYPQIRCEKDENGVLRLVEVWICLDSEEHKTINCPKTNKIYKGCVATDTIHLY